MAIKSLRLRFIGRAQARFLSDEARFLSPPFKPCVRISRTRLTDGLLDSACEAAPRTGADRRTGTSPPVRFILIHTTGRVLLAAAHSSRRGCRT